METGKEIRVASNARMNRQVGQTIEVSSAGASGVVAVGKIVAVIAGAAGAVTLVVRVLAGG